MPEGLRLREGERVGGERDTASGVERWTGAGAAGTDMVVMNEAIFVQRNLPWRCYLAGALIGVWLHSKDKGVSRAHGDRGMGVCGMPYHTGSK